MEAKKVQKVKKLGSYFLLEPSIGEGTFGKVYKCFHIDNQHKLLAAKCLSLDFYTSNPSFLEKLKRELKLTKNLKHSNIIKLHDLKRTKNHLYLMLEFCNGDNLDIFTTKYLHYFKKQIPLRILQFFIKEIVNALFYLSSNDIVHRDIKLENIMMTFPRNDVDNSNQQKLGILYQSDEIRKSNNFSINLNKIKIDQSEIKYVSKDPKQEYSKTDLPNEIDLVLKRDVQSIYEEQNFHDYLENRYFNTLSWNSAEEIEELVLKSKIKLIDFGLGKDLKECGGITNSICGSPITMAPEIWSNKIHKKDMSQRKKYDGKVDIWSLGCIAFHLYTGDCPFEGESWQTICHKIFNDGYYKINYNENLTLEFIDFINGLLQMDTEKRFTWQDILSHPFLNNETQTLLSKVEFDYSSRRDTYVMERIKKDSIILSINEYLDLVNIGRSKGLICDSKNVMLEGNQNQSSQYSLCQLDDEYIEKIFETYEVLEDFYFSFEEKDGYVIVSKNFK